MNNTLQTTVRLYLTNPEVSTSDATIIEIYEQADTVVIVTDQTPFYPKGGGQPSDVGYILAQNEKILVHQAIIEHGAIGHVISKTDRYHFALGQTISLSIDQSVRFHHSAIHTAGELICATNRLLGYDWPVVSAIHYPDNASIDFDIQLDDAERERYIDKLQNALREHISAGSKLMLETYTTEDEVVAHCGYYPTYIKPGEPIRIVTVLKGVYGRPCAGTHLENINDLLDVKITKVKNHKGKTQVRYHTMF